MSQTQEMILFLCILVLSWFLLWSSHLLTHPHHRVHRSLLLPLHLHLLLQSLHPSTATHLEYDSRRYQVFLLSHQVQSPLLASYVYAEY